MKYFINIDNIDELKIEYKKLAVKLHPDNGGDTAEFQVMQAEFIQLFEELKQAHNKTVEESGKGFKNNESPIEYADVIDKLLRLDGIIIELCGSWLWISGNTKQYKDELKKIGCKYASKKQMWYYRLEKYKTNNKKKLSIEEIREKYGSQKIENNQKRLAAI